MGHGCSICSGVSIENGYGNVRRPSQSQPQGPTASSQQQQKTGVKKIFIKKFDNTRDDLKVFYAEPEDRQKEHPLYRNLFNPQQSAEISGGTDTEPNETEAPSGQKSTDRPVPVGCEDDKPCTTPTQESVPVQLETTEAVEKSEPAAAASTSSVADADKTNSEIIPNNENGSENAIANSEPKRVDSVCSAPYPSRSPSDTKLETRNSFALKLDADNFVDHILAQVMVQKAESHQFESMSSLAEKSNEDVKMEASDSVFSATSSSSFIKQVLDQINTEDKSIFAAAEAITTTTALDDGNETDPFASMEKKCCDPSSSSGYAIDAKLSEKPMVECQPSEKLSSSCEPADTARACSASSSVVDFHVRSIVDDTLGKVVSDLSSSDIVAAEIADAIQDSTD